MNKNLFRLITAGALVLALSCSDDVVEKLGTQELTLTVNVRDAISGKALKAKVSLDEGEAQTASESGVAVFNNVNLGEHNLQVSAEGGDVEYAAMLWKTTLEPIMGAAYKEARDFTENVMLLPLTSKLEGYLFYTDKYDEERPVPKGTKVIVQLDNEVCVNDCDSENRKLQHPMKKIYTAETDENGKYSFDNLPAVKEYFDYASYRRFYGYSIYAEGITVDGINFNQLDLNPVALVSGGPKNVATEIFNTKTNVFVVTYPGEIEYKDNTKPITLKFSEPVDRSRLTSASFAIAPATGAEVDWKSDNTEVELTPMGKWQAGDLTISLAGVISKSGKTLSPSSVLIRVLSKDLEKEDIKPELLNDKKEINYNGHYKGYDYYLKWKKVEGINGCENSPTNGYMVFANNNDNGTYVSIPYDDGGTIETSELCTVTLPRTSSGVGFINHRKVGFLVQGANANSKTTLDPKNATEIEDVMPPTTNSASSSQTYGQQQGGTKPEGGRDAYYYFYDFGLAFAPSSNPAGYTRTECIRFSEPIDYENVKIELSNDAGNANTFGRIDKDKVEKQARWSMVGGVSEVCLDFKITGNPTALVANTNLKALVVIKDIKDQKGNPFEVTYTNLGTGGNETAKKTNLEFKIYTSAP